MTQQVFNLRCQMRIDLREPAALDERLRFAIREGGRTIGSGVVTKVLG